MSLWIGIIGIYKGGIELQVIKCPVCNGTGKTTTHGYGTAEEKCSGCSGRGWVELKEYDWSHLD